MSNQSDNLNRAKRELKNAEDAERDARKAYDRTDRNSNASAKRAWDSAKRSLSSAQADVRRYEAELAESSRGQARSFF